MKVGKMDNGMIMFIAGFLLAGLGMSLIFSRDKSSISSIQAIANSKNETIQKLTTRVEAAESSITQLKMSEVNMSSRHTKLQEELGEALGETRKKIFSEQTKLETEVAFLRQQVKTAAKPREPQKLEVTIIESAKAVEKPKANGIKSLIKGMEVK